MVVKFLEIVARLFCRMDKNLVTLYFLNYSGCNLAPLLESYEKERVQVRQSVISALTCAVRLG